MKRLGQRDGRPVAWWLRWAAALLLGAVALSCSSAERPIEATSGLDRTMSGSGLLRYFEAPPPDQALMVIFRPPRRGRTGWTTVYEDDQVLALFGYHSYIAHLTAPGPHRYMIVGEAADFLDADLAPGKIYFAEVMPRVGAWRARFSLVPYPWGHQRLRKLEQWLAKSDLIVPGARETEWAANNGPSVQKKRDAYLPKWLSRPDRPTLSPQDGVSAAALRSSP